MTPSIKLALLGALGLFLVLVIAANVINQPTVATHMIARAVADRPPSPMIALLSSRGGASSSAYHTVEGEVLNIGNEPLRSVVAVATWYDKADTFISSDTGLVEYDPLMPGQKSPFKVIIRSNPLMHAYTVGFKAIGGAEFSVDDRRKSTTKKKP